MSINRLIFKNSFEDDKIPKWTCPTCNHAILVADSKNIKTFENSVSLSGRQLEEWEHEWIRGVFLGKLECSNRSCNETVLFSGKFHSVEEGEYDYINDSYNMTLNQKLTPNYFNPPVHIFNVRPDIPREIKSEIIDTFNLYWVDTASCANKIRTVIELILNDMKVAKTYTSDGKRKGHTLHKRIEVFKATKPKEAELLMAIKWIGNSGSHQNDGLTKDDILDAYEILEHVTYTLYDNDSKRISKLSKTINKKKKPIGKSRTKK